MKAIILDLDNTLIDFAKTKVRCCEAAVDAMIKNGLKMSKDNAMKAIFELYGKYGWEDQFVFQKMMKKHFGRIDYSIITPGIFAYRKMKESLVMPFPGVKETIKKLRKRGYKIAVLSDAPGIQAWMRITAMDMHKGYFDHVITRDITKVRKPNPKAFKIALKALKVRPEDAAMVGDSFKKDIYPAKRLGMKAIYAEYGPLKYKIKEYSIPVYTTTTGKSDLTIRKFSDLLKILK